MPSVAFIAADFTVIDGKPEPNGCAWYRGVLPARQMNRLGWDSGVGLPAFHQQLGIGLAHGDGLLSGWDRIVMKLVMHRDTLQMIHITQERGTPVLIDVDDFHADIHPTNVAFNITDPHQNPEVNRAWYEQSLRIAARVTVATEFLANYYERRCRDVVIIRNGVDTARFPQVDVTEPVIGWVGGLPWRAGDVEMLRDWLPGFVRDYGWRVHHSGHIEEYKPHFAERVGVECSTTPLSLISDYPGLLQPLSVGLVPLTSIPFNEAKSCLKGLEYAASGIPFIASPTREYRLLAEQGVGRLAATPDEWRDHAVELTDVAVRQAEGARIRQIVQERFDIEQRGPEWATAIHS